MSDKKIIQRRRGDKQRALRQGNASFVERNDSHLPVSEQEMKHYASQMKDMFGNTQLPGIVTKGKTIPRRVLSNFSPLSR